MKNPFAITLLVLLGISAIGNLVLYNDVRQLNTNNLNLNDSIEEINFDLYSCQNEIAASGCIGDGFAPAKIPLSISELNNYSNEFKGVQRATVDTTTGGIISLEAIKAMSCIESCNAIAYTFGRNISNADRGPKDNGLFIMMRAVNVTYDAANDKITRVNNLNSAVYYGGYWCPTHCLPFN